MDNKVLVNVYGGGALRLKQDCRPTFIDCDFIGNNGGAEVRPAALCTRTSHETPV